MKLLNSLLASLLAGLMLASGAQAQVYTTTFENGARVKGGLTIVDGGLTISSGSLTAGALAVSSLTSTGAISGTTITGSGAISGTTITGSGAITGTAVNCTSVVSSGAISGTTITGSGTIAGTTITGSGAISGASLSVSTPITNASIGNGAKRQILQFVVNAGGTCADSTVYSALLVPGRAGTVKAINVVAAVAPTAGTDTIAVKKGSSAGNTMFSAANIDANGLVANTVAPQTLTATGADLSVTATQPIYAEYSAGAQTIDAAGMTIQVEFEPSDF